MKAWLVTWEWGNDAAAVADAIVTVLNPRLGDSQVASIVSLLYANATSTVGELAALAKKPSANPYPARFERGRILCGANPWMEARLVQDLKVTKDPESGYEIITWLEPGVVTPVEDGGVLEVRVGPSRRAICIRRRDGSPSSEFVWDRAEGRFKTGWVGHQGVIYSAATQPPDQDAAE